MDGDVRVWKTTTVVRCEAIRHDSLSAYKNLGCRCPEATRKAVSYERRRQAGRVLPSQPAELTRRRLQALAVIGWSADAIAPLIERHRVSVSEIRCGHTEVVTGATAAAVARVYKQLHDQRGPSDRTRSYAAQQGWAGPSLLLLYGDVDEVVVARAVRGDVIDLKRNERLTAVQILSNAGRTYRDIAARLHVSERQVHRDLADLGLVDRRAQQDTLPTATDIEEAS